MRYVKVRKKLRKLDDTLNERSKAIPSLPTTNAEVIELIIEITPKDTDTTVNDVEWETSFVEASDRDKLLPLRESE